MHISTRTAAVILLQGLVVGLVAVAFGVVVWEWRADASERTSSPGPDGGSLYFTANSGKVDALGKRYVAYNEDLTTELWYINALPGTHGETDIKHIYLQQPDGGTAMVEYTNSGWVAHGVPSK